VRWAAGRATALCASAAYAGRAHAAGGLGRRACPHHAALLDVLAAAASTWAPSSLGGAEAGLPPSSCAFHDRALLAGSLCTGVSAPLACLPIDPVLRTVFSGCLLL